MLMLFCISDPDLQQDPAFPCCCLTKWSLQELFTDLTGCNTYINSFCRPLQPDYFRPSNISFQHKLDA